MNKESVNNYLKIVKGIDREREIKAHGKLISTRPLRIKQSKKIYKRNNKVDLDD